MKKLKLFFLITNILLILNTKTENSDTENLDNEITFVQCPFSDMSKDEILEKVDHPDDLFYYKFCLKLADVINNKKLTEAEKVDQSESILTDHYKWEPSKKFYINDFLLFLDKYKSNSDSSINFKKLYNKINEKNRKINEENRKNSIRNKYEEYFEKKEKHIDRQTQLFKDKVKEIIQKECKECFEKKKENTNIQAQLFKDKIKEIIEIKYNETRELYSLIKNEITNSFYNNWHKSRQELFDPEIHFPSFPRYTKKIWDSLQDQINGIHYKIR
jgi:hypothetical protein